MQDEHEMIPVGAARPVPFKLWFEQSSSLRRRLSGLWESGNPAFGFLLFHGPHFFLSPRFLRPWYKPPELWECGNLAAFARFPRSGGKAGKPDFGFPGFPPRRHFHSSPLSSIETRRQRRF